MKEGLENALTLFWFLLVLLIIIFLWVGIEMFFRWLRMKTGLPIC